MEIDQILDSIYVLPLSSKEVIKKHISALTLKKGHLIIRANKVEPNIYFIKKGIVRAFADVGDNEITFWFGQEGATIISMKSYVEGQPGYENIELLEDCELYKIDAHVLQDLFKIDIDIANWGRKFAEMELIGLEERIINHQFKTATERYKALLEFNSDLLQRVQLSYIASYLGITQVSLSRIRSEVR